MVEKWTPNGPQNCPKIDPGAQNAVPEARQVAIFYDFSSHHRFSMFFDGFFRKNQWKNSLLFFTIFALNFHPNFDTFLDQFYKR